MIPHPVPRPSPHLSGAGCGEGTVGEAFAIAPGTFLVPGRWPGGVDEPSLLCRSLVVRGAAATVVVDTVPAPMGHDWLAAVLALVDPDEVRWLVLTAVDAARAGSVDDLLALCPRATVVAPGSGPHTLDLGGDEALTVDDTAWRRVVVQVPRRRVAWCDVLDGAYLGPCTDLGLLTDDEVRAGLAHHPGAVPAEERAALARLDLRALGSPVGPVARGTQVARALALLAERDDGRATPLVAALHARLGRPPWTAPRSS